MTRKRKTNSKRLTSKVDKQHLDLGPVSVETSNPKDRELLDDVIKKLQDIDEPGADTKGDSKTEVTAEKHLTPKQITERELCRKKIIEGVEKVNLAFEKLFTGKHVELKRMFHPWLSNSLRKFWKDDYDIEWEVRNCNPPLQADLIIRPYKQDLDSLMEVALHYQNYSKSKRLPPIVPENVILLRHVLLWWKDSVNLNEDPDALTELLKGSVTRIVLHGSKGKLEIAHAEIIRQVIHKIQPYAMYLPVKRRQGQPKSKLFGVLNFCRKDIQVLKDYYYVDPSTTSKIKITNEYLYAAFQMINEKDIPDFDSFRKTLDSALKDQGKELPLK